MKQEFQVIDVRSREEFAGGHVVGSINIPLHEIPNHLNELKTMKQPILFCCLSGGRSGQATQFCQGHGIDCTNGGGWMDVNFKMNLNGTV